MLISKWLLCRRYTYFISASVRQSSFRLRALWFTQQETPGLDWRLDTTPCRLAAGCPIKSAAPELARYEGLGGGDGEASTCTKGPRHKPVPGFSWSPPGVHLSQSATTWCFSYCRKNRNIWRIKGTQPRLNTRAVPEKKSNGMNK